MIKGRFVIQLFVIGAGLALQPVQAAAPEEASAAEAAAPNAAAPNAQTLGLMEGALHYCADIDPPSAERLRGLIKQVVDGANDEQVAKVRQSDEYRTTYDSVTEVTSKIDPPNAKPFCASAGAGGK